MKLMIKLAWRNLWRNKRRSLITISSVLFAVFFAVVMRSFQIGTYDLMIKNVVGSYTGYAQIQQSKYKNEPSLDHTIFPNDSLYKAALSLKGVIDAVPRIEQFALFSKASITRGGMFVGIDPEREIPGLQLSNKLISGQLFSSLQSMEIIMSEGLAEVMKAEVGDSIILISQGYRGQSAYGLYPVVGIVKMASPQLNRSMAFLPLAEAQYLLGADGIATQLVLHMDDDRQIEETVARGNQILDEERFKIYDWKELMPELVQTIEADGAGGIIMIFILYMVIAFGLFGTVLMMTAERQREFGVLVALGMKRSRLAIMTGLESMLLTLLGCLAGLLAAAPIVTYFYFNPIELSGQMKETMLSYGMEPLMPASIQASIAIGNAGVVVMISLLCAIYPMMKILQINAVKAMRS
jgi:ABC-type lipoprotein release transport system permease subunit